MTKWDPGTPITFHSASLVFPSMCEMLDKYLFSGNGNFDVPFLSQGHAKHIQAENLIYASFLKSSKILAQTQPRWPLMCAAHRLEKL